MRFRFAEKNNLEGVRVDASDWDALVENKHVIEAEEGLSFSQLMPKEPLRGGGQQFG